jgi:hypothetical protein
LRREIIVVLSEDDMTDHRINRWIQPSRRPSRTHALFGSGTRRNRQAPLTVGPDDERGIFAADKSEVRKNGVPQPQ